MNRMVVNSRIGPDGVLNVIVPVGTADANREVKIIIEPTNDRTKTEEEWQNFITSMAGSWQGEFERPDQGQFEQRDPL
jgi:hypothetical protein